jgi:hypothetical protein
MQIYCDEELDMDLLDEDPNCFRSLILEDMEAKSACAALPDDVVSILADYSCEYLSDQLTFSLLSSQHRRVTLKKYHSIAHPDGVVESYSMFKLESLPDYFVNWSQIRYGGKPNFVTDAPKSVLSFYCKSCRSLIITQNEVDSPHYHGGYGPAFLANFVYNCHHSADEAYETQFTTGVYRVCDVTCLGCQTRLGKKYIEARDPANYFKVGKILLEQTLLTMPKCCNNRKIKAFPPEHYFCARESGVSCFCSPCIDSLRTTTARAVLSMTNGFETNRTSRLLSLLLTERSVLSGGSSSPGSPTPRHITEHPTAATSPSSTPKDRFEVESPSISRRVSDAIARLITRSTTGQGGSAPNPITNFPTVHIDGATMNPHDEELFNNNHKMAPELVQYLSHLVGSRIAMLPESQNWIASVKFVSDLISATSSSFIGGGGTTNYVNHHSTLQLYRSAVLESLVSNCGELSFHSATLLLSRVDSFEDRRAVLTGIQRNRESKLSKNEIDNLVNVVAGSTSGSSPRWFHVSAGGSGEVTASAEFH